MNFIAPIFFPVFNPFKQYFSLLLIFGLSQNLFQFSDFVQTDISPGSCFLGWCFWSAWCSSHNLFIPKTFNECPTPKYNHVYQSQSIYYFKSFFRLNYIKSNKSQKYCDYSYCFFKISHNLFIRG